MKKVIGLTLLLPLVFAGIYRVWFSHGPDHDRAVPEFRKHATDPEARTTLLAEPDKPFPAPSPPSNTKSATASQPTGDTDTQPASTAEPEQLPDNLYTRFDNEPPDPQWSEEHEILIENFLFSSPGYVDLDIESISCKSTLCEIKVSERENTVWAKVAHDLAREQGWQSTAWKYADYYDENGKRIIHAIVGKNK